MTRRLFKLGINSCPGVYFKGKKLLFFGQFRQKVAKSKKSHNFDALAERVSELDSVNSSSPQN